VTALLFFRCTVGSVWSLRRHDSSNFVATYTRSGRTGFQTRGAIAEPGPTKKAAHR
jgi:hypothetical protein